MGTKGLKMEHVCWRGAVINALLKSTSGPLRSRRPTPSGFQAKNRVGMESHPSYAEGSRWRLKRPSKMLLVPQGT